MTRSPKSFEIRGALAVAALLALSHPSARAAAPPAPAEKPTFLLVGTFHFQGSSSDLMSNHFPDVLAPARQQQIEAVVDALARFRPTKIAIEAPLGSTKAQEEYAAYRKGTYTLTADEIDQIAYRLAKKLGHERVHPVDRKLDLDFDKVFAAAAKSGKQGLIDQAMAIGKGGIDATQKLLDGSTVGAALRQLNDPRFLERGLDPYYILAQIGEEEAPGAEMLADWLKRNLLIYHNLTSLIETPGERVLLLMGAGHVTPLRSFIAGSPNLKLEEAAAYLP